MIHDARDFYEMHREFMAELGIKPLCWEELTEEQRAGWAEHAFDVAAKDKEVPE